jgi:hypothetical protein
MKEISYRIGSPAEFKRREKEQFVSLLKKQDKVQNPTLHKVERCRLLCFCIVGDEIVSIGAIKPKTVSDFSADKSDLTHLSNQFNCELGYFFTLPDHCRKGYSSAIASNLLSSFNSENIMASTELRAQNSMLRILERNGFKQFGQPWQSSIHGGALGLFLKFN